MQLNISRKIVLLFLSLSVFAFSLSANNRKSDKPKLVVMITIDGLQSELLDRYWNSFGEDGFKRLINDGYYAPNTPCSYIPTGNAADYASLYTGSYPLYHGIVSVYYYSPQQEGLVSILEDNAYRGINSIRSFSPQTCLTLTTTADLQFSHH